MADEIETQTPEQTPDQTPAPESASSSLLGETLYGEEKPPETPEDEPEGEPEGAESSSEDSETEETPISSFEELAEHYELDPEWLQSLKITTKVNGQPVSVAMSDALATHRKVTAADMYLSDAKQKAKAIVEETKQQQEALTGTVATFSKLLEAVEDEINRDVKAIDWKKLREEDQSEYLAKKEDVRERRERLDKLKKDAGESFRAASEQAAQKHQEALKERLPKEFETFLERIPEWNDDEKASAERAEVAKYLGEEFSEQDIKVASYNGKLLAMAVKAMRYDKSKAKSKVAKKKVTKVPKVMKPGPSKDASKPNGADKKDDPASILYG